MPSHAPSDPALELDAESIVRFYRALRRQAERQLPKALMGRVGPDDLVQETMLVALSHTDCMAGRTDRERQAWLSVILQNRIRMALRRSFVQVKHADVGLREQNIDLNLWANFRADDSEGGFDVVKLENVLHLHRLIEGLPLRGRRVIIWYYFDDHDLEWIADRLGISSRQVRRILKDALESLLLHWHRADSVD